MFRRFNEKRKNEEGFTLIELLVVILIIAILAAIAIPVFLRQREKGWVSQMESALKNAATAAESYSTGDGNGSYAGLNTVATGLPLLEKEGFKYADDVTIDKITTTATTYCIQVSHDILDDANANDPMMISESITTPTPGTCA